MTIDFGKPVQTRDGRPVRILCTDAAGPYSVTGLVRDSRGNEHPRSWTSDGSYIDIFYGIGGHPNDLVQAPEPPREAWVNIHACGGRTVWFRRDQADEHAAPGRIACVRIEYRPGDGLEEG